MAMTMTRQNTMITKLQEDLAISKEDDESLANHCKKATELIEAKHTLLEALEQDRSENLEQLETSKKRHDKDMKKQGKRVQSLKV